MVANDTMVVDQLAAKHADTPEEALFKVAALALKTVDAICEACQGKIDPSLDENMRGVSL